MNRLKFGFGVIWALPVTIVALLVYVAPFCALKWYKCVGVKNIAIVFTLSDSAPNFLKKAWERTGGHTFGNVVVFKKEPDENLRASQALFAHEMTHVRQYMCLGLFMPIMYCVCSLIGKILEKSIGKYDSYFDNPFEIQARRNAGQVIDVIGLVDKLKSMKK